jgi:SAM-dependent methyltransferase
VRLLHARLLERLTALISESYREHIEKQKGATDRYFADKRRNPTEAIHRYIANWRILEATRRLVKASHGRVNYSSRVLLLCAADAFEASALCDVGFTDVTISDISAVALGAATERDQRLKTMVLDVENLDLPDRSFDVVVVQDGLHHLRSPIRGFTEMLRVCTHAAFFLEPHDSKVGSLLGKQWELDDGALNYVFRWNRKLVQDVAASFLVSDSFSNLSFSFWHHNRTFERICSKLGMMGESGCKMTAAIKFTMDSLLASWGNQFCGMILRND